VYDGADENILSGLDYYEGYYAHNKQGSHYLREPVNVGGDEMEVYVYNRDPKDWGVHIPEGDWNNR